jgi:hypothetical protein
MITLNPNEEHKTIDYAGYVNAHVDIHTATKQDDMLF